MPKATHQTHPVYVQKHSSGSWKISVKYRGKDISLITTNSMAIDDYNSHDYERSKGGWRQLFDELKASL